MTAERTSFFEQVYLLVSTIPRGSVATYGLLAALLGVPRGARAVGWALRVLPRSRQALVPWHRVVGAGGRIALRGGDGALRQRRRLQAEGVVTRRGRVDMSRHDIARPEVAAKGKRRQRTRRKAASFP